MRVMDILALEGHETLELEADDLIEVALGRERQGDRRPQRSLRRKTDDDRRSQVPAALRRRGDEAPHGVGLAGLQIDAAERFAPIARLRGEVGTALVDDEKPPAAQARDATPQLLRDEARQFVE